MDPTTHSFRTISHFGQPITAWLERHANGEQALYFKDLSGQRFYQVLPPPFDVKKISELSYDTLVYRYRVLSGQDKR